MHEQDFLAEGSVAEFAAFVRDLVVKPYPGLAFNVGDGANRRSVSTLAAASDAYRWRGESFAAVNGKIESLRAEIRAALCVCGAAEGRAERRLAELELLFASTKTLSWGRVYEGAFPFLIHQAETGVLSENLRRAAALIDGPVEEVGVFDDSPYRSDCGMTKIYAAINERTVVYDDRLGAALGWLCRRFHESRRVSTVPAELHFMVGEHGDPRRDPSGGGYRFTAKGSGREHARWNIRANWLLSAVIRDEAVTRLLGGYERERLRRLEAALFMIGDELRDQPRLASPPARAARACAGPMPVKVPDGSS